MDKELQDLLNKKCLVCDIEAEIRQCESHYSLEVFWQVLAVHLEIDAYAISLFPSVMELRDTSIPIQMIRGGFDMALVEDYYLEKHVGADLAAEVAKNTQQKPDSWDLTKETPDRDDIKLFVRYGYQSAIYLPSKLGTSRAICTFMSRKAGIISQLRDTLHKLENCFLATHAAMQGRFYNHYKPYTFELTKAQEEVWSLLCQGRSINQIADMRGTGTGAVNQIIRQLKESLYPNKTPEEIKEIKTAEITFLLKEANYF